MPLDLRQQKSLLSTVPAVAKTALSREPVDPRIRTGIMSAVDDKQLEFSVFAWFFNVSTSVVIVFVNKVLMGRNGYMFNFGAMLLRVFFTRAARMCVCLSKG
jgi:hypothetical protein